MAYNQDQYFQQAAYDLGEQVKTGGINQSQANNQLTALGAGATPWNVQGQNFGTPADKWQQGNNGAWSIPQTTPQPIPPAPQHYQQGGGTWSVNGGGPIEPTGMYDRPTVRDQFMYPGASSNFDESTGTYRTRMPQQQWEAAGNSPVWGSRPTQNPPASAGTQTGGLNLDQFHALQQQSEQEGRRMGFDEWVGAGGAASEYAGLYQGQIDQPAFEALQAESSASGRKITPEEWMRVGGDWQKYHQLYNEAPLTAPPLLNANNNPTAGLPDPSSGANAAIDAQAGIDRNVVDLQERYNRNNTQDPWSQTDWIQNADGSFTKKTSLSGTGALKNANEEEKDIAVGEIRKGSTGQVANALSSAIDYSALPKAAWENDVQTQANQVGTALMDSFSRDMEPRFDQERQVFEQRMADEGTARGTAKYERLERDMLRRQEGLRQDAQNRAIVATGEEHTRLFDLGIKGRQGALGEVHDARNTPINEMGALNNLIDPVRDPVIEGTSQIQVPRIDAAGIGTSFAQFANSIDLENMSHENRIKLQELIGVQAMQQIAAAKGGGGGGGGGGGHDLTDLRTSGLAGDLEEPDFG